MDRCFRRSCCGRFTRYLHDLYRVERRTTPRTGATPCYAAARAAGHWRQGAAGAQCFHTLLQNRKKMTSSSSSTSIAATLTCSICSDDLMEPVSTPCGHNFCRDHLVAWVTTRSGASGGVKCPECRAQIQQRPEDVRINTVLRDTIEAVRAFGSGSSSAAASLTSTTNASSTYTTTAASSTLSRPPVLSYDAVPFDLNNRGQRIEIGRGAFSSVFAARWLGDSVAAKVLILPASGAAATLEAGFWREASLHYHLTSPQYCPSPWCSY